MREITLRSARLMLFVLLLLTLSGCGNERLTAHFQRQNAAQPAPITAVLEQVER
jgi:hypothetical protein